MPPPSLDASDTTHMLLVLPRPDGSTRYLFIDERRGTSTPFRVTFDGPIASIERQPSEPAARLHALVDSDDVLALREAGGEVSAIEIHGAAQLCIDTPDVVWRVDFQGDRLDVMADGVPRLTLRACQVPPAGISRCFDVWTNASAATRRTAFQIAVEVMVARRLARAQAVAVSAVL